MKSPQLVRSVTVTMNCTLYHYAIHIHLYSITNSFLLLRECRPCSSETLIITQETTQFPQEHNLHQIMIHNQIFCDTDDSTAAAYFQCHPSLTLKYKTRISYRGQEQNKEPSQRHGRAFRHTQKTKHQT
jgi:hypothetical protein